MKCKVCRNQLPTYRCDNPSCVTLHLGACQVCGKNINNEFMERSRKINNLIDKSEELVAMLERLNRFIDSDHELAIQFNEMFELGANHMEKLLNDLP